MKLDQVRIQLRMVVFLMLSAQIMVHFSRYVVTVKEILQSYLKFMF